MRETSGHCEGSMMQWVVHDTYYYIRKSSSLGFRLDSFQNS